MKKNILFFCNDIKLLKKMLPYLADKSVYCISQNIEIYGNGNTGNVVFLPYDSGKGQFIRDVLKIVNSINNSFESIATKRPHYLYELSHLWEGGVAGQYIDYLYAIDFFNQIILDNQINLILCEKAYNSREIDALMDIANTKQIKIFFMNNFSLKKVKEMVYFSKVSVVKIMVSLRAQWQSIERIRKISKKNEKDSGIKKYDVGYILTSDLNKHLNWLLDELSQIEQDLNCCIFCYHADENKKKLIQMGKTAKSVEAHFDWKMIWPVYMEYLQDACRIWKKIRKIKPIIFQDINITKTICNLYLLELFREKLNDIIYEKLVYDFLKKNQVKLITGNGDTNYISNKIFYYNLQKLHMDTIFYKDYVGMEVLDCDTADLVHEPYSYIINLRFFSKGSTYLQALKKSGWTGRAYYMPDLRGARVYSRYPSSENEEKMTKSKLRVLWAPSYPTQGLYSLCDFTRDNYAIFSCLNEYQDILTVKYHPHQDDKQVREFYKKYAQINRVRFVDKYQSIEKYIENVDVVITTVSTVVFDAAIRKKLVVCIVNSVSEQLIIHLKDYFYLVRREDLNINKILNDRTFRENQIMKQNMYLERLFYNTGDKNMVGVLKGYLT